MFWYLPSRRRLIFATVERYPATYRPRSSNHLCSNPRFLHSPHTSTDTQTTLCGSVQRWRLSPRPCGVGHIQTRTLFVLLVKKAYESLAPPLATPPPPRAAPALAIV